MKIKRKIVDKLKAFVPYAVHLPAYKLGRWDGTISFATTGGRTYINLLDKVLPIIVDSGHEIEIDDKRVEYNFEFDKVDEQYLADRVWPEGHRFEGQPVELRDYQVEAINDYLENLQSFQEISTAAGKTLLTATLSKKCEKYGRTIVIVPSKDLVTQTEEDYRNLGLDVGVFFGDRKEWNKTHTICTWQSLAVLDKKSDVKKKPNLTDSEVEDLQHFLTEVIAVIVDEGHTAKGELLKNILSGPMAHIPIRWGLTGTIPKEDFEFWPLLSCIGPVVGKIKASELQAKSVLANCNVNIKQLIDYGEYKQYPQEKAFLLQDETRMAYIADQIQKMSETGNTLVLIQQIKGGKMLHELIPDSVFINGSVKSETRKEEYASINTEDNKIVIATYGVASTGINLPRIFNLVLIEAGKSFTQVIQSIGRGLRKAKDKDHVEIWDITSTLKFSKRHLTQRKKYYAEAEYDYKVKKVDYLNGEDFDIPKRQ